jgi:surface protein
MSKVTNVENFTWQCLALTSIDTTGWDISNVNNMYTMFINAQKLTEIKGIEDWNTSNVKTMISVFYACKAITSLDLSRWNVKNVTTIWWLFNGCTTLQTLNISNWNLANCVDYTEPFKNCKVLDTIVMNNSDYKSVNKIIQGLPAKSASAPGILKINGVDDYNQVIIDVATSKYWTVEYVYNTASFDTKLVSLKNLNTYSQKMSNHYKNLVDERISNINESVNEQVAGLQSSIQALENNKADVSYVDEKLGVVDGKIEDINESVNEQVAGLQSSIQALENNKVDISYVNGKLEVVDAIKLNGYSLWVGTTTELEAIENRDPNTLYFEIGDDTTGEEVVQVDIVNGVLQLTDDKYQKTNMVDGTEILFPSVNKFTEIHLYFAADSNMNISLPDNCKWRVEPNIEEGNSYEIIATYNTIEWLVNVIVYS